MHSMMCSVNHNLEGRVGRRISLKRQEAKVKNLGMVHPAMVPTKKTKRQDQITNATITLAICQESSSIGRQKISMGLQSLLCLDFSEAEGGDNGILY